jgi:PST family polysaccharide transporter
MDDVAGTAAVGPRPDPRPAARGKRGHAPAALRWAFVMNWGQRGLATIVSILVAAVIGPEAYGVVAMALIYITFIQLLLEQGISSAIIQRADLDPEHLDSAFWMNMAWCVALAGVSILMAGWWADLNKTPQLEPVIDVLSFWLILSGLTIVQQSILQRELKFKKLALRSNLAALVGAVVGIVLALEGAGVWAVVTQQMVTAVVSVALLWTISRWLPRFRFSRRHARELLGFSGQVFAGNMAIFVNRRVDALMLGLFFGPVAVGVYRFADRVVESVLSLVARPVQLFSLPEFSRHQRSPDALRRSVFSCMRLTLLTTVPTLLIIAVCGKFLVGVLGDKWSSATPALQLLSVAGISKALILFTGPLLVAMAKPALRIFTFWFFAAVSAATFAVVAIFIEHKKTHTQVLGMAASRAALFALLFLPVCIVLIAHLADMPLRRLLPALRTPVLSGGAAVLVVLALELSGALDGVKPIVGLCVTLPLAALAAGGTVLLLEPSVRATAARALRKLQARVVSPRVGPSEAGP